MAQTLIVLVVALACIRVSDQFDRQEARRKIAERIISHAALTAAEGLNAALLEISRTQRTITERYAAGYLSFEQADELFARLRQGQAGMLGTQVWDGGNRLIFQSPRMDSPPLLPTQPLPTTLESKEVVSLSDLLPEAGRIPKRAGFSEAHSSAPDAPQPKLNTIPRYVTVFLSADEIGGLVPAGAKTDQLGDFAPSGTQTYRRFLFDGKGTLAWNSDGKNVPRPAGLPQPKAGQKLVAFDLGAEIGAMAPVGATRWTLVVLRPLREVLGKGLLDPRTDIPALIGVIFGVGILLYLIFRLGVLPLTRLSAGARLIGIGDLSFRLPAAEVREFEPLTDAFNGMAERLEAAQSELLGTNQRLELTNQTLEERVRERTQELEAEQLRALLAERQGAEEREKRARLEQELDIGRTIQTSLLSPRKVVFGRFEVLSRCEPATEVGGDLYNIFEINRNAALEAHELGVLLGDVAGKGVPAAIYMAVTTTLIEGQAQLLDSPVATLAAANAELYRRLRKPGGRQRLFVTALYGILDSVRGEFRMTNAGQTPPIFIPASGRPHFLQMRGTPLGALRMPSYREERVRLARGDRILLYSDGFTEVPGPNGLQIGCEGLLAKVSSLADPDGAALIESLFRGGKSDDPRWEPDDRTLVLITCTG